MGLLTQIAKLVPDTAVTCVLYEWDTKYNRQKKDTKIPFQYFPETITDSKSPSYDQRSAPGSSHPILQFNNGGARTINFTAVFTQEKRPKPDGFGGVLNVLQGKASLGLETGKSRDTVVIQDVLAKLRSYTYPVYEQGVAKAPPVLLLLLPGSGIVGHGNFKDSLTVVMTDCQITYQAFHRSGEPRIVEVNLSFIETIQISDKWKYIGYNEIRAKAKEIAKEKGEYKAREILKGS